MDKINIPLTNIEAVIFDMDGTMVNNMQFHKKAWKEFCKKYGLNLTNEDFDQKISGKKNNEIFKIVFDKIISLEEEIKYTEEKEALYRELYKEFVREVPGLSDLIRFLKQRKIKLAIATTATDKNRVFILSSLNLDNIFDVILGDEDVKMGKPNPEIYLLAAKKLKVSPSKCLVFEDSPPGVLSGKSAGMKVVGVLTSHAPEDLKETDYLIDNFSQIEFV